MSYNKGGKQHQMWYPTPKYVEVRLTAAAELGCSVAVWEIGQGIRSLFDLM